jgi:quercetin dioxygenase-like cupin family protein
VIRLDVRQAAREAVAVHADRPATAIVHDAPDVRLVVFRLAPGQRVPLHRSASTVQLTVLDGGGILTGEAHGAPVDAVCATGDVVVYAPNEQHGMRAVSDELLLLATITPRPGSR